MFYFQRGHLSPMKVGPQKSGGSLPLKSGKVKQESRAGDVKRRD